MLIRHGFLATCLLIVAVVAAAPPAEAASLDIRTGFWKKTIKLTADGLASEPMTLEVCFTKENLDFDALLKEFPDKTCKWTKKETSPKRVDVAFSCSSMSGVSVTEVKSADRVVVESTIDVRQEGKSVRMKSSEEWSYVKADCPKEN